MGKKLSHRILVWILFWFAVLGAIIAHFIHIEIGDEKSIISQYVGMLLGDSVATWDIERFYWIGLGALLILVGLFLWLSVRLSIRGITGESKSPAEPIPDKSPKKKKTPPQIVVKKEKISPQDDQRRALHLLCLLQREGRLVDFLEEDLTLYEDAQIGAAVRSIQENCQKSLKEYLALKAVIDQEEGEEVTIQAGFDANAIKLTGKITGDPPFKGILQHRGWQTSKFNLPALSGTQNPKIIFPAEVEVAE